MNFWEHVRTGWLEIRAHKLRSFLSFFSISIGIASILYTFGKINSVKRWVSDATQLMGPGRMEIEKKRNYVSKGLSPGLTFDDAAAIRERFPDLYMVSPEHRSWGMHFRFEDFHNESFIAWGVSEEWRKRDWVYTVRGRFFDAEDLRQGARVCVLLQPGGWVKKPFWARYFPEQPVEKLLKQKDLLGKTVYFGDHLFTVIGILKEPPRDQDRRWGRRGFGGSGTVLVPMTTYHRTLARIDRGEHPRPVEEIQIDTGDENTIPIAKKRLELLLKARHRGEEDYEVKDNREEMQGMMNEIRMYMIAVVTIGVIAILAGGIGIMNVTLATIFSRIKEIGIRRALGATRRDILLQFIVEAMILGFLGGVAGLMLGSAGVWALARERDDGLESLMLIHYAASLFIAVGAGFFFALYPASQAAKLDPVQALHYE